MQITLRIDYNGDKAYNIEAKTRKEIINIGFNQTFPECLYFISEVFKENLCKDRNYKLSSSPITEALIGEERLEVLESIVNVQNLLAKPRKKIAVKVY